MSLNASNGSSDGSVPKGSSKKLVAIIVSSLLLIGFLGLVGLYCLGRIAQERKQTQKDLADGKSNAVDCLNQLDKLEAEQKKNGTFKPESQSETELIVPTGGTNSQSESSSSDSIAPATTTDILQPTDPSNQSGSQSPLNSFYKSSSITPSPSESSPSSAGTTTDTNSGANGRNPFQ
jgi:hypothetical protein